MQHRKPAVVNGRPSGTDGSDFSYRMVVDSRYTKVAKGKSRLSVLFFTQAIVVLNITQAGYCTIGWSGELIAIITKGEGPNTLAISSTAIGFLSLLVGELGRRRSRVNFLRFYMFASSIAITISIARVGSSNFLAEVIQDQSQWDAKKFELVSIAGVVLGLLLQIFTVSTTISLIHNMSPPKRAS